MLLMPKGQLELDRINTVRINPDFVSIAHLFLPLAVLLFLLFPDFLHNLLKQNVIVFHCLR